ncbi:hypothetical protein CkaCkLH20_07173 [Colletotrichum karsti]|uniref:Azaphilone pigments biosynthesis cluster protein L N-terminal domain-containing protein n=1 Tax=Colletotrichum karsti TaxID=1095194 RepID=A0A9P6LJ60_9PEZI|nr:uncharacterized protein CkaCkLH20_07173 [Colletotrichum karsti]KAF9875353.1 hypothetical protein CkaCkLH20_07173 [Colletotrichum karsti]
MAFKLTTFVRDVRDSRNEIDGVTRELLAVKGVLEIIADDIETSSRPLPSSLQEQLSGVISNCTHVVGEVDRCIRDHEGSRVQKGARWVAFGRGDMARLRSTLEAHKSTLNLAVEMISLTALRDVQQDTTVIKGNTDALVKDSKDLVDGTARILEAIAELQAKFPGTLDDDSRFFMLQRYLDGLTSYAETVCDDAETRFEDLTLQSLENSDAESSSSRVTNKATPTTAQQTLPSGPVLPRLALPDEAGDDLYNGAGSLSTALEDYFRSEAHDSNQKGPTRAESPDGESSVVRLLRDTNIQKPSLPSSEEESFSVNTVSSAKSLEASIIQGSGKSTLESESVSTRNQVPALSSFREDFDLLDGELSIYGRIPFAVAQCGAFLKDKGTTEQEGDSYDFNSPKILCREFNTPPFYGLGIKWHDYTCVDATRVLVRYFAWLCRMEKDAYHEFLEKVKSILGGLEHLADSHAESGGSREQIPSVLAAEITSSMAYFCEVIANRGEPTVVLFRAFELGRGYIR